MSHSDYTSIEWRVTSIMIKRRDNFECQVCKKIYNLNVHHVLYIPYVPLWFYPQEYLITLCEFCHGKEHLALNLIDISKFKEALLSGLLAQDIINHESLTDRINN